MDLVKPSLAIAAQFGAGDDTGAASDADSTPSGRLVIEGAVDAASVTVSDDGTGDYEASVTIPASTGNHGKGYQLQVSMTMGGITTPWVTVREGQIVPANVYDSLAAGSDNLEVDTVAVGGTTQTARDIGASVLVSSGTGTGQLDVTDGVVTSAANNMRGTDGANTTTPPDSTAIQAAVNAALVALHLDHIFAAAYDPDSKPGSADGLFNKIIVSDSGVPQLSANALELSPTGSGGGGNGGISFG